MGGPPCGSADTISQRMARNLLTAWAANGFVLVLDPAKKSRKYELSARFKSLLHPRV